MPRMGDFVPIGKIDLAQLGLPRRRAQELLLEHAWSACAGAGIARRVRPVRVRRGVLELRIPDPAWAREVEPLLPTILSRLARRWPELEVQRFRLLAEEP